MSATSTRPRRRNGLFACRRGTTAIEFAFCAPPLILLVISTFEIGWFYFVNATLDAAAVTAARFVRTGEAQEQQLDKDAFYDAICHYVAPLGDCRSKMTLEVKTYATFADLAADGNGATCVDDLPAAVAAIPYEPGLDNQIVRVRICYMYTTLNPAIGVNLSEDEQGRRHLVVSQIFRNEPFSRNQR